MSVHTTASPLVEQELNKRASAFEKSRDADLVTVLSPIVYGLDNLLRDVVESRKSRRQNLAVILETPGGYIQVVQRIVETFRRHYARVDFYVPDFAMSAGTVLVMSGDAIHMDHYSRLGPIDPQIQRPGGDDLVPALGYLAKYQELLDKSEVAAQGKGPDLTRGELAVLLNFDQASLYGYEQARQLSITLLIEWLAKYKFRNWTVTQTTQTSVTDQMREDRAKQIAEVLNDTSVWHSHGRFIPMDRLKEPDINLVIDDFGQDAKLSSLIRSYHGLLRDYLSKTQFESVVHTPQKFVPVMP